MRRDHLHRASEPKLSEICGFCSAHSRPSKCRTDGFSVIIFSGPPKPSSVSSTILLRTLSVVLRGGPRTGSGLQAELAWEVELYARLPAAGGGITADFATSGWAADAPHPVLEAPPVSVSVRARRRSPLHALRNRIRELR